MNWDYVPIGQNYTYNLWTQPDDVIEAALDREMPLLKAMGVNAIRQYVGVPPRWVRYIYERYGIFTVHQPHGRPLRLHRRRRLAPVDRLLRPARPRRPSRPRSRRWWTSSAARPAC